MNSEKSKPVITTKPATQAAGNQAKAVEAPHHHASAQRRMVAADEERKEKEARGRAMRKYDPHHAHKHDKT